MSLWQNHHKTDEAGKTLAACDEETGCCFYAGKDGSWTRMTRPTKAQTQGAGKVTAIVNAIAPEYGNHGPIAGFMDSTGDFNFCSEFASLRLVICFNRASRKVTDGGGLIAEVAMYEKEALKYNLKKARKAGDILYILQGRDENGMRSLRPSESTIRLGESTPRVFASKENSICLDYFKEKGLSVKQILETYSILTDATDPANPFGFTYGFLDKYDGYRSKE